MGMPGTKVHLFGSRAVGLHLPFADMDMVLQLPPGQDGTTQVEARARLSTAVAILRARENQRERGGCLRSRRRRLPAPRPRCSPPARLPAQAPASLAPCEVMPPARTVSCQRA